MNPTGRRIDRQTGRQTESRTHIEDMSERLTFEPVWNLSLYNGTRFMFSLRQLLCHTNLVQLKRANFISRHAQYKDVNRISIEI